MAVNKIEEYLIDLMYTFQEVEPNFWLLEDPEHDLNGVTIIYTEPLVIIRVNVMDAPKDKRLEFFTKLLELNASDLVHGAYGLDGDKIVLINTLQYDHMSYAEFRAVLDAFSLALSQHYPLLSSYRK